MASTTDEFVCFNRRGKSNGHFFSCHDLYDRGVWVGHLTPDKLGERYKGLPSFNELKTNCKKFNEPYPASIAGVPGDERHAVCRGCVGSQSQLITLREIKFTGKTKLAIMPLDGAHGLGMFCILIPLPNDRSLKGLQLYRPYEHRAGKSSNPFTSHIMLAGLRNKSQSSGTVETVREIMGISPPAVDTSPSPSTDCKRSRPVEKEDMLPSNKRPSTEHGAKQGHKKQKTTKSHLHQPRPSSRDSTGSSADSNEDTPSMLRRSVTYETEDLTNAPSASLFLTKDQSQRIRLVWVVEAGPGGTEYCFSHTIANCDRLVDYFDLVRDGLEEDDDDDQSILTIMERSIVWRLSYKLPGLPKKAFTVRAGDETGYEKLLQSLAQCPLWNTESETKIDVELRVLK